MKKKIGLLIPALNGGGAERVVSRLTGILGREYEVFLILFEDTYIKYDYKAQLINLNIKSQNGCILKKIFLPIRRYKKLKRIKKELNLDVVISFLDSANIVNILSRIPTCKTVVSVRNYFDTRKCKSLTNKIKSYIMMKMYNKSDKVISVSKIIEQDLLNYRIRNDKISTIYNPYDIDEILYLSTQKIDKEYEQFFKGEKIFISIGRRTYQKGFWHLIKAFSIVNKNIPESKLVIIGEDYQNGKVEKLINDLGIEQKVMILPHQDNPFKYIANSSVYVLSSLFEGFPNSMVEALACGCPVISADCKSGPKEILYKNDKLDRRVEEIEKAEFGILVPELNEKEDWNKSYIDKSEDILATAMMNLIQDENLMNYYSQQGKLRAVNFSYEQCKKEYISIIESI